MTHARGARTWSNSELDKVLMLSRPHAGKMSASKSVLPFTLDHSEKHWDKRLPKRLISSVDTDLWMIVLLGMSCGRLVPLGEGAAEVTVWPVVGGGTKHLLVNRVCKSTCQLQDESESACPEDGLSSWCSQRCAF